MMMGRNSFPSFFRLDMNLIIDQGNSSAKIALFDGEEMIFFRKYTRFSEKEARELRGEYAFNQAIRSSVVGEDAALTSYLSHELDKWVELTNQTPIPIGNLYKTPQTLGRDRIAVCVGANYLYPNQNLFVIDAGTAITYDVINSQNQYVGGNISLGIEMRRKALHDYTAKLPLVEVPDDVPLIGTTTEEAISSGVINGIAYEIQSFIDEMSIIYPNLLIFLTGGSAKCFERRIKNRIFVIQNLVHIGLNRILNY